MNYPTSECAISSSTVYARAHCPQKTNQFDPKVPVFVKVVLPSKPISSFRPFHTFPNYSRKTLSSSRAHNKIKCKCLLLHFFQADFSFAMRKETKSPKICAAAVCSFAPATFRHCPGLQTCIHVHGASKSEMKAEGGEATRSRSPSKTFFLF